MIFFPRAGAIAAALLALIAVTPATAQSLSPTPAIETRLIEPHVAPVLEDDEALAQPVAPTIDDRLRELVVGWVDDGVSDAERECLAGAIYFEARGEPLSGQLAVAQVVLNRARSGVYPATWCDVITQRKQFSFVRGGKFPRIDRDSASWRTARAVADIAAKALVQELASDVLWYHADYVSPSWGQRLVRATQIGRHIFYQRG